MDTRIEELATIILERCRQNKSNATIFDDRADTYKGIAVHAMDIMLALDAYRQRHPEEYD